MSEIFVRPKEKEIYFMRFKKTRDFVKIEISKFLFSNR